MKIELIEGPNGKAIPAQRVRVIYIRNPDEPTLRKLDKEDGALCDNGSVEIYVSHFETCPNANDFSKGRNRSARHRS
jgi:hypothetical protein